MKNVFGIIAANYTANDFGGLLARRTIASLPFGGRYRLVDFALSNMVNSGIGTVGLIMPAYYRSLIDHVGSGKEWNLDKKIGGLYILPGTVYGGHNTSERFLLSDLLVNHRYIERREKDTHALITSSSFVYNMDYTPFIKQHIDGDYSASYVYYTNENGEKVLMDCFMVKRSVLLSIISNYSAYGHLDIVKLIKREIPEEKIGSYEYTGYVKNINSIQDYVEASRDMLKRDNQLSLFMGERQIRTKIQDEAPTRYGENAKVTASLVSAGCEIDGTVEQSVISRSVIIEEGAYVKNCIIFQHCRIKKGARLENAILDKYVKAGENITLSGSDTKPLIIGKNMSL